MKFRFFLDVSKQLRPGGVFPGLISVLCCWLAAVVPAQGQVMKAEVIGLTGSATVSNSARGSVALFPLRRGEMLQPGDILETGNGRVTIAMGDGSQITVYPSSRVVLRDFRSAASWRDLLEVMRGRVRATINHSLKRPNPYRVFSPIASIAVRGTDFLVQVESNYETDVRVYEGLVEVASLVNPQQNALVRPGRNVIVRPGGNISLVSSGPGSELNAMKNRPQTIVGAYDLINTYNDSINSLIHGFDQPRPARFLAFPDSSYDSFQNPAYAAEFKEQTGQIYLQPSLRQPNRQISTLADLPPCLNCVLRKLQRDVVDPINYASTAQASYFAPIGSKMTVGGIVAMSHKGLRSSEQTRLQQQGDGEEVNGYSATARSATGYLSFIAARRFGRAERTSLGIEFDYLREQGKFVAEKIMESDFPISYQRLSRQTIDGDGRRLQFSFGITHDLGSNSKLGAYYRQSMNSSHQEVNYKEQFLSRGIRNPNLEGALGPRFSEDSSGISEFGALFRSSLTERLLYSVESTLLFERSNIDNFIVAPSAKRGTLGIGIGYVLRPRTVLSFDLATGLAWANYTDRPRGSFYSLHGGAQTDLWRNLFVSGSFLAVKEGNLFFKPSRFGFDAGADKYHLSNLGPGWRFKPDWLAQYIFSSDFGRSRPSHSLILRYDFSRAVQKKRGKSEKNQ